MNHGTVWQRVDFFKKEDGDPSSISWKEYMTMCFGGSYNVNDVNSYLLKLNNDDIQIFKGGYFIMNLTYRMSQDRYAHDVFKTGDVKFENNKYTSGFTDTMIPCRLSI